MPLAVIGAAMLYHFLADFIVALHLSFVLFVLLGGFLVLKWRWILWIHLGALLWGAAVEFSGWICPLTPLENWLRENAGSGGYRSDFVAHYILPALYPAGLTRGAQIVFGIFAVVLNLAIYRWVLRARGKF